VPVDRGYVIVTGSSGDIGSSVTQTLSEAGFSVVGVDCRPGKDTESAHVDLDLALLVDKAETRSALRSEVLCAVGDLELAGIINLAATQVLGDIDTLDPQVYLQSFKVNALAPLMLARLFLEELTNSRGTVINVSSIHATLTKRRFSAYSTSKAAMSGLTRALSIELGSRLRVIEIRPAAIATAMLEAGFVGREEERRTLDRYHPSGHIGTPEEVSRLCLALLENASPFLNGAVINLDGGISHVLHDPG
jgi:NAD(P)-dependent dehydrogenase (short-subunit alcohol dehydrogenase family)